VADVVSTFLWQVQRERGSQQVTDLVEGAGPRRAQEGLQLGEGLLDGNEVRTIGREEAQLGADGFNGVADGGVFVDRQIIEDDDVAGSERGREHMLDIARNVTVSIGPSKTAGALRLSPSIRHLQKAS